MSDRKQWIPGSKMSREEKYLADQQRAGNMALPKGRALSVEEFMGIEPPHQIMAWDCLICGIKNDTFEEYKKHPCTKNTAPPSWRTSA